jgi:hypothetical protein
MHKPFERIKKKIAQTAGGVESHTGAVPYRSNIITDRW